MWFAAAWRIGYVKARLPGDVYRVEFLKPVNGCKEAFLSCNTYGGPADQDDFEEGGK